MSDSLGLDFPSLVQRAIDWDCLISLIPRRPDDTATFGIFFVGPGMVEQAEILLRPLTAEGEDGPPASVYLAGPDLLVALERLAAAPSEEPWRAEWGAAHDQARDAIRKART